jgi:hypothetical protein
MATTTSFKAVKAGTRSAPSMLPLMDEESPRDETSMIAHDKDAADPGHGPSDAGR